MAVGRSLVMAAPAKINLHLEILGRRADGFHELETVFQTLELADRITCTLTAGADRISLSCSDPTLPGDASNLAWRGAEVVARACPGLGHIAIHLEKHLPHGAGLGGGSSDAAAVLRALAMLEPRVAACPLADFALEIGSDVPFFLHGGTVHALGRGEQMTMLTDAQAPLVTLLMPDVVLPTPRVFAALTDHERGPRPARGPAWWEARMPGAWLVDPHNRLTAPAGRLCPAVASLIAWLQAQGVAHLLCGSGAACVAFAAIARPPSGVRALTTHFRPRSRLDQLGEP